MKLIKFRQPVYNNDGTFNRWHYWGWLKEGYFVAPIHLNPRNRREKGQQYIGLIDKNGVEIYEGLNVIYSGEEYTVKWNQLHCCFGLFNAYGFKHDITADWCDDKGNTPKQWQCSNLELLKDTNEG